MLRAAGPARPCGSRRTRCRSRPVAGHTIALARLAQSGKAPRRGALEVNVGIARRTVGQVTSGGSGPWCKRRQASTESRRRATWSPQTTPHVASQPRARPAPRRRPCRWAFPASTISNRPGMRGSSSAATSATPSGESTKIERRAVGQQEIEQPVQNGPAGHRIENFGAVKTEAGAAAGGWNNCGPLGRGPRGRSPRDLAVHQAVHRDEKTPYRLRHAQVDRGSKCPRRQPFARLPRGRPRFSDRVLDHQSIRRIHPYSVGRTRVNLGVRFRRDTSPPVRIDRNSEREPLSFRKASTLDGDPELARPRG